MAECHKFRSVRIHKDAFETILSEQRVYNIGIRVSYLGSTRSALGSCVDVLRKTDRRRKISTIDLQLKVIHARQNC